MEPAPAKSVLVAGTETGPYYLDHEGGVVRWIRAEVWRHPVVGLGIRLWIDPVNAPEPHVIPFDDVRSVIWALVKAWMKAKLK